MKIYKINDNHLGQFICLSGSIDDYDKVYNYAVNIVINCRAEQHDDIYELTKRNIAYYWIPIPEGLSPRKNQIELFLKIMSSISKEKRVLVHCSEGRGRSPMLLSLYLRLIGMTIREAWAMIKKVKKDVSLTETQRVKLSEYIRESEI